MSVVYCQVYSLLRVVSCIGAHFKGKNKGDKASFINCRFNCLITILFVFPLFQYCIYNTFTPFQHCGAVFEEDSSLVRHMEDKHMWNGENAVFCREDQCDELFEDVTELENHVEVRRIMLS